MVYYKFGRCTVCQFRLRPDNVYTLKNCNHTFHHECVTRWITEGSQDCPRCRETATLTDIKQLFVEEAGDSSDDSGDEFTQSSSNVTTQNPSPSIQNNEINVIINDLKTHKINVPNLKASDLIDKKIGDLLKTNNLNCVVSLLNNMVFVKIKNKWKEFDIYLKCCDDNCINTNKPIGNCIEGTGYVNLINDENIKYLVGNGDYDQNVVVYAENFFKKPQNSFNYSLYYFEVKCIFEKELNGSKSYMQIGLRNCSTRNYISYYAKYGEILNGRSFKLPTVSWNNNDIFGCGLVYPPTNKLNEEFPYVFFTQNGKQIGKGILLKYNSVSYKPRVFLNCCSIEANFGNDLETKPFKYDISKHVIIKEFY